MVWSLIAYGLSVVGSFVIVKEIRTSIAKKPYIFVIFHVGGGVRTPCPPCGSAHDQTAPKGTD